MQNNSFISEVYLKKMIKKIKPATIEKFMRGISSWYADVKSEIVSNISEEEYELEDYIDDLISPVLSSLRYKTALVESSIDKFLLFADSLKEFKVATLYATHFSIDINKEEKGNYPGFYAVKLAKEQGVRWAFLTNGIKWRIYDVNANSPYETYIEVDLSSLVTESVGSYDNNHKVFMLFFEATTFYKENSEAESTIEECFKESEKEIEKQEKIIRDKIEGVLTEICYGFKNSINKSEYSMEDRQQIFEDAIILLYRLLFIQYAEARELLPVSNEIYSETSLNRLAEDARVLCNNGKIVEVSEGFTLWEKFDSLRGYINVGWEDINMVAYNGGLFDNDQRRILRDYSLKNSFFAVIISELSFLKDKNGKYEDKIDYRDLSVRNLGSLYEGILEYNLFIADEPLVRRKTNGKVQFIKVSETTIKKNERNNIIDTDQIYFSQNATERKETGSYYTPEDVVNYIISSSLGVKLNELKNEFEAFLGEQKKLLNLVVTKNEIISIQKQIDKQILEFIEEKVLSLSVLDSSMGSGHFLVNATFYISNFILELINSTEWKNPEVPASISYWKIKVVSHCIYGIDINPLAVHLGKLSLWLVSAAKNKPLTFIDHHIKTGNSLLGLRKDDLKQISESIDEEHNLFTAAYNTILGSVLEKYEELRKMPENTRDQVHIKKEKYELITKDIQILKIKYDIFLAMLKRNEKFEEEIFNEVIFVNDEEILKIIQKYRSYYNIAKEEKFFHWELEFPEIINNKGFSVIIGNPPYVEVKQEEYNFCPQLKGITSTRNLYSFMISNNLKYLSENGKMALIVLLALVSSKKMNALREELKEINGKVKFMNIDSATYPGRLFKGLMIRLTILSIEKAKNVQNEIYTTNYLRFFQHEREHLFKDVPYTKLKDRGFILDTFIPKIGHGIEQEIINKMFNKTKLNIRDFIPGDLDENDVTSLYFRNTGAVYYCMAFPVPPFYQVNGQEKISSTLSKVYLKKQHKDIVHSVFHSSLFYWFWTIYSDCYHFTGNDLNRFPINLEELELFSNHFSALSNKIIESLDEHKQLVTYKKSFGLLEYHEYRHRNSKAIFDEVDTILAKYYGFSDEELDYIINYDLKYRVGS